MEADTENIHLWDMTSPLQQDIVSFSERYKNVLNQKRPELTRKLDPEPLWSHLRALSAINDLKEEEIKCNGNATRTQQMESLLDHLERGPTWRLHAFFRVCVLTNEAHIVSLVGLQPEDYTLPGDPPVASPRQGTRQLRPSLGVGFIIFAVAVTVLGIGLWFIINHYEISGRVEISWNSFKLLPRQHLDGTVHQGNQLTSENDVTSQSTRQLLQEAPTSITSSSRVSGEFKSKIDSEICKKSRKESQLTTAIYTHGKNYQSRIMMATIFDIADDPDAEVMDMTDFYIDVNATLYKDTKIYGSVVKESDLFREFNGDPEPTMIRLSGAPGVGKSTYIRHLAYSWSVGELDLKLVLYVHADLLDGDIWSAIRNSIWCEETLQEAIIEYIQKDGEGVVIAFDGTDEVRNQDAIRSLQKFIDKQKYRKWPKMLVSARSGLHRIKAGSFQRSVELHGFTLKQGIQYVSKHGKAVQAKTYDNVMNYVDKHNCKLLYLLRNCLYAHTFSVLAFMGKLNLEADEHFSTFTLMQSMIEYRLEREYNKRGLEDQKPSVLQNHAKQFHLMCLYIMITERRQYETCNTKLLTDDLLKQFGIDDESPYHVFLNRKTSRGLSAHKVIWHTFDHEVSHEHFIVRGIIESPPDLQRLILLILCSDKYFLNIQRILIEGITESKRKISSLFSGTLVTSTQFTIEITRGILLLQNIDFNDDTKNILTEISQLHEEISRSFPAEDILSILLRYTANEKVSRKVSAIWSKVNDVFESKIDLLRDADWFGILQLNWSLYYLHIILQELPTSVKIELYKETIYRLLPYTRSIDDRLLPVGQITTYAVGQTRWATVTETYPLSQSCVRVIAWSPGDAREALEQHYNRYYAPTADTSSPKQMNCLLLAVAYSHSQDLEWGTCPSELLSQKAWLGCLHQVQSFGRIHALFIYTRGTISGLLPHIPGPLLDVLGLDVGFGLFDATIPFPEALDWWNSVKGSLSNWKVLISLRVSINLLPEKGPRIRHFESLLTEPKQRVRNQFSPVFVEITWITYDGHLQEETLAGTIACLNNMKVFIHDLSSDMVSGLLTEKYTMVHGVKTCKKVQAKQYSLGFYLPYL